MFVDGGAFLVVLCGFFTHSQARAVFLVHYLFLWKYSILTTLLGTSAFINITHLSILCLLSGVRLQSIESIICDRFDQTSLAKAFRNINNR